MKPMRKADIYEAVYRDRLEILKRIDEVFVRLGEIAPGVDPVEFDALLGLHGYVGWSCPLHPEADPDRDFEPDSDGCAICARESRKRARQMGALPTAPSAHCLAPAPLQSEATDAPAPPASDPPAAQAVAPSEDDDYGAWLAVRNR